MSTSFHGLLTAASDSQNQDTYRAFFDYARNHVTEEEIHSELVAAVARKDWEGCALLLECINCVVNKVLYDEQKEWQTRFDQIKTSTAAQLLTPLLCEVLYSRAESINHEDIIDLFDMFQDERSIPSLISAVPYEFLDTMSYWPNRKALWALSRFDRKDAWEAIERATGSDKEPIAEEARKLLAQRTSNP